jgi:hypothetical protein
VREKSTPLPVLCCKYYAKCPIFFPKFGAIAVQAALPNVADQLIRRYVRLARWWATHWPHRCRQNGAKHES